MRRMGRIGLICLAALCPWVARGADVTAGYTWTSGELVTHSKLNTFGAGTIASSFYSGKASAGANPNTTWQILLRDTGNDVYKRTTLADGFFDHSALLSARTLKTAPTAADTVFLFDAAAGAYKQCALSNLVFAGLSSGLFSGVVSSNDVIPYFDADAGTYHGIQVSNLIMGATAQSPAVGTEHVLTVTAEGNVRRVKVFDLFQPTTNLVTVGYNGAATVGVTDGSRLYSATLNQVKSNFLNGYVCLQDRQASGTDGGTLNSGTWGNTRNINTIVADPAGLVTGGPGSTNAWTLAAGVYRFQVSAPGLRVNQHQCMLTNQTDGVVAGLGTTEISLSTDTTSSRSVAVGMITNATPKVFGVRHRVASSKGTDGGGLAGSWGTEIYTTVEFWKLD